MSQNKGNMSVSIDPALPSLQETLTRLFSVATVAPARLDRVKAAVAKTSRILNKHAADLPAHLPYLMRQLNRTRSGPDSVHPKTLANTKAEIRFLIRTVIGRGTKSEFTLLPVWGDLRSRIVNQSVLWKLSRFLGYCSARNLPPDQVTENSWFSSKRISG
jgi:hypothetical protein